MAGSRHVAAYSLIERWKASWQNSHKSWTWPIALAALILLLPLGVIVSGLLEPSTPTWAHLKSTVLWSYATNSIILMLACGLLTAVLGVSLAWLVSMFEFPGRKFFRWALLLPLAFPTYIAAFEYAGIFDYTGPWHLVLRSTGMENVPHIKIMNHTGLIVVLSLVLYPYTFAACRVAFESRYGNYMETARSLGMSTRKLFFKVMLPMARPAIYGGSFLVMMEVLNDYGAMKYFGINTFTTGIFSAWFSMGDLTAALRLAAILLVFALILSWGQGYTEKKFKTTESSKSRRSVPLKVSRKKQWLFTAICALVFFVAFVMPIAFILWQLGMLKDPFGQPEWFGITLNSLGMAALATGLTVLFVVLMQFVRLLDQSILMKYLGRSVAAGYAIPGAIIAVGVLAISGVLDGWIHQNWLVGSMGMMVLAYILRFSGVAFQPIQVEIAKRSGHMIRTAQSLGAGIHKVFSKVYLPLGKKGLITACMLVFVDVLKELPLTLILRPFNFETLATKAFEYASDEMLMKAALPSLLIVLVGLIPVFILHKSLDHA